MGLIWVRVFTRWQGIVDKSCFKTKGLFSFLSWILSAPTWLCSLLIFKSLADASELLCLWCIAQREVRLVL